MKNENILDLDSSINLELDENGLSAWFNVIEQFKIDVIIDTGTLLFKMPFLKFLIWYFKLS